MKAAPHMDSSEIKNFFTTNNINVKDCINMNSRKNRVQSSSFLISTNNKDEMKKLTTTTEIEHTKLKWEENVKRNIVTQCYRCQDIGHGSTNCFRRPRCLKCAANHTTKECPIKEKSEENQRKLKCCNCGGNHSANFHNCPNKTKKTS